MREFIGLTQFSVVLLATADLACGGSQTATPEGEAEVASKLPATPQAASEQDTQAAAPDHAAAAETPDVEKCPSDNPWAIPFEFHGRCLAFVPVTARDNILAIFEPKFVGADNEDLPKHASVMGVSINGYHRAYPIAYLSSHEVVNDTVGGVPILITW